MSMIYRWILFIALFGISLSCSDHPKNSSSDMEPLDIVELRPADKWLKFPIDEDTDIGWYPTVIEKDEREYIIIKNSGMPQLLFYDVDKICPMPYLDHFSNGRAQCDRKSSPILCKRME